MPLHACRGGAHASRRPHALHGAAWSTGVHYHLHLGCRMQGLLKTYNIGVDPEERNKAMVEAVAKRVGFSLPAPPADWDEAAATK